MRLSARLAALATASLLTAASAVALAGAADAAPAPTLTGTAPATAHGPGTVTFSYTLTLPVDEPAAQFSTRQPVALPALATDVTVDGTAVPAVDVTQPSSVDISFPVSAPLTPVTAGTHTITFTAEVGTGASALASSTAAVAILGEPTPVASAPVVVAVNQPDLSIAFDADDSDGQPGTITPVGTGQETFLAYDVKNLGYGTPDALLALTLPAGLALGEDGVFSGYGGDAQCAAQADAQHVLCDLGAVPHYAGNTDPEIDITVVGTAAAVGGTNAVLGLAVAPAAGQGIDTNPANNVVSTPVHFTGSARLSYTITPADKKVALGKTTNVTLTVHNAGPQPAGETVALGVVIGKNFTISHFSGKQEDGGIVVSSGSSSSDLHRAVTSASASSASAAPGDPEEDAPSDGVVWDVGTIPAGKSVSAVLTIKAVKLGTAKVGLIAFSDAGNPACPNFDCALTTASVQAVPVPVVVTTPPATTAPAPQSTQPVAVAVATSPQLANTGSASRPALGLAVLLLIVGGGLTVVGRRRRA